MTFRKAATIILIITIAATLAFIWSNSLQASKPSNEVSNTIANTVKPVIDPNNAMQQKDFYYIIRKSAHFFEFLLLGSQLVLLKILSKKPQIFTVLFIALTAAVTDESIQIFTGRTDKVSDILIDFIGALCGMLIAGLLFAVCLLIKKWRRKWTSLN